MNWNGLHESHTVCGRKVVIIALAVVAFFGATGTGAQSIAKPVATVHLHKSQIISSPQFRAFVALVARLGGEGAVSSDQCRPVLETLIDQHLLEQEAVERQLILTEAEVDQQMTALRRQIEEQAGQRLSDEEWRVQIQERTGLTLKEYRNRFAVGVATQRLVAKMQPEWLENIQEPAEEVIQQFYNQNIQQLVQPDMVLVHHIHFSTMGLDEIGAKQAKQRSELAMKELSDGASFDELVVNHSDDGTSRYNGGELGNRYLRRDDPAVLEMLGGAFLETLFSMNVGETSTVVESKAGFHILRLADRLAARLLTLNDPVAPRSSQTVRGQISALLMANHRASTQEQAAKLVVGELREQADIEIFEDNLASLCPAKPA